MKHSGIRDDHGAVPRIPLRSIQATDMAAVEHRLINVLDWEVARER